jgi:hypothetical protein
LFKNDINGRNGLRRIILEHYQEQSKPPTIFWKSDELGFFNVHFLISRKYVARYGIGEDRSTSIGGVQLAIGPHYFSPEDLWTRMSAQRFSIETSENAIRNNLKLLDDFLDAKEKQQI